MMKQATTSSQQRRALLTLVLAAGALVHIALAKPLHQNQVKFRRLPPKEFGAAPGSSITVECEAGSSPPPTIHWLKNGKRIAQNDVDDNQLLIDDGLISNQLDEVNRIALSSTRSRLFIDCADSRDEATYTCVAENAFSRVSASTKLNLIRDPVATALELAAGVAGGEPATGNSASLAADEGPAEAARAAELAAVAQCMSQRNTRSPDTPRIHMWTHNIVEIMTNNVVLYCRSNMRVKHSQQKHLQLQAQQLDEVVRQEAINNNQNLNQNMARQHATLRWSLPDERFVSADMKDKYEILNTGDLLIKDLRWADMGSYVCQVSDDHNSDSISTFVYPASLKTNTKRATLETRLVDFR